MKRKHILVIITILVLLVLGFSFYQLISYNRPYHEALVLLDDIQFGMSPHEVENYWGAPDKASEETILVSSSTYYYQNFTTTILDNPATVYFKYILLHNKFVLQSATITFSSVENPDTLLSELRTLLKHELSNVGPLEESQSASSYQIYHNRGPVGTSYSISIDEKQVIVSCYCSEFYR